MMIYGDDVFLFLSHIYIYIYIYLYLWLNFLKIAKISEKWWKMEVSLFHQSFDICYGDLTIKHWRGCAWISQRKNIEKWNPTTLILIKYVPIFWGGARRNTQSRPFCPIELWCDVGLWQIEVPKNPPESWGFRSSIMLDNPVPFP